MISNGPSRSFTHQSIESWFLKLSKCEWEKMFSEQSLRNGRKYYKNGTLNGLDISQNQVIFIRKINRQESYSIVEWNGKNIEFRTSLDSEKTGQALAVAGLYELEELISEIYQCDPMLEEHFDFKKKTIKTVELVEEKGSEKEQIEYSHKLLISLEVSNRKGLSATPYWESDAGERFSAYSMDTSTKLGKLDRPKLMRFAREASDYGFSFHRQNGSFLLEEWNQVAKLAEEGLKEWEQTFSLEFNGDAELIRRGRQSINWELQAQNHGSATMTLKDAYRIGSKKLKLNQLRGITKLGNQSMFLHGHGLVRLEEKQLEDFDWWRQNKGENANGEWPRYMLFSLFARKHLKTKQDGALEKWQGMVRDLETKDTKISIPFLRPYQKEGVARIQLLHKLGCHCLLADEMGLGKTIQALAILSLHRKTPLPNLVVCPASVVPVWISESKRHFPKIQVKVLKQGSVFDSNQKACLWIASYTQLRRHRNLLEKNQFQYAILDEAQMIKNPKAKVTQACLSIHANHRIALTGTPVENSALDLWTIFRFLMPGLLGNRKEMEKSILIDPGKTHEILRRQVAPFVLRRLKNEVAKELPPKIEADLPCRLNEEQTNTYRRLAEEGILDHGENLPNAIRNSPTHLFALLTRLRQSCCDLGLLPRHTRRSSYGAKGAILVQKLNDLSKSGSKAIIFSQFTSFLNILEKDLRAEFPGLKLLKLTGNTRDRAKPVKEFQDCKDSAVILASLKAAGTGITLTAADYVFLMDPWWNPAVEEQAIDRAHRIGREKPTFIYRMIAQGTIEERVRHLQLEKKQTFQEIIGDLNKPTQLSKHFTNLKELIEIKEIN